MRFKDIEEILTKRYKQTKGIEKHLLEEYEGRDVIIPDGRYKGREAKIQNIHFDVEMGKVIALYRPYRLKGGKRSDFLWHNSDTRSYREVKEEDFIKKGIKV